MQDQTTPASEGMAYGDASPTPEYTNLDTTNTSPLSDDTLSQRASRADFALGDKSPGPVVLKDAFKNGQEPAVRQQAASDANTSFQQDKLDHIKAAQSQGTPITDDQVNTIMSIGTTPEANPDTVLEDKFAKNIVSTGVIGDPSNNLVFQTAFDTNPDETREGVQKATAVISRKQQAAGLLEETQAAHDQLPWFHTEGDQQSKAGDMAINILSGGLAQAVNQRNLLNASPSNSWVPGSNKLEQIQYLYLLPHDQFLPALRSAAGPGSELWKTSPSDALDFIKSAVQYSTSDSYADNVMGVANLVGEVTAVGQARSFMKTLQTAGQFGERMAGRAGAQVTTAEQAARDVLSASSTPPTKPTALLSSGSATGQDGINAASNALDILSAPNKPPAPGYYVPEAGLGKTTYTSSKNYGEFAPDFTSQVAADGTPRIFNKDGVEVQLSRTPDEGHYPVQVNQGQPKATYTTRGGVFEHNDNTIYVDKAGADRLSKVLDEEGPRKALLQQADGRYSVGDLDNQTPGKTIRGTITPVSNEPARGLIPIELNGNDRPTFGQKITRIDEATPQNVTLGPKIVPKADVEARVALADVVKSQAETNPQDVLSKMGQHEAAATTGAKDKLTQQITQTVPLGDIEAIRRQVPSLGSPQLYYSNASSMTRELADRLAQQAIQSSLQLTQAITDPARVERLTQDALDQGIAIAKGQVKQKYNRNADAILDQVNLWDSASNRHRVETRFGKKDGTLFDSSTQAQHYKDEQYKLGEAASVRQEGNQFYISHMQDVDETQTGVRNSLIVSGNETPRGWWNSLATAVTGKFAPLGNSIRSSAYTMSDFAMNNRVITTQAPSIMRKAIEDTAKGIELGGKWTTGERQEMQTILEHNRDYMSPDGVRGQFYKSALEFETAFNDRFGYMPSDKQIVAYDQFTRLSDLDYTLRELDSLRDKSRLGVRNYKVTFNGTDDTGLPSAVKTDWFNAKLVKDFDPKATPNANVYVMPEGKFTTKYDLKKADLSSKAINDKLTSGEYQILQVFNPREKPLMATTGVKDDVHFIVTNKFEDKAVEFGENVPYRPGGHVIYQDQHYLKQSKIGPGTNGELTHFGDTTIKAFSTERETNFWADRYNEARKLIKANDHRGLEDYINAGNLPETLPQIKQMFSDGTLSPDIPLVHTFAGRDTLQSSEELARAYPGLKDTFSAYNLSQVSSGEFLADRGAQLNTIANAGTEANPIYNNVASRLFDPFTSLQKGMAQIVRSRWMADEKISAAESWIQEFGMLFDQSKLPIEKLRQNPTYWLYHGGPANIDAGVMRTNPELVTAAMTARKNIMNFIGARDEVGGLMDGLRLKLIDSISSVEKYTGAGQPLLPKNFTNKVDETFLPAITNAPEYARQASFHAVIGLFNPVQLWQQAQGLTHVYALAPQHAFQSTTASALVRMYRLTEDAAILDSAADKAAALGWKKEDFLEAIDSWKKAGVHNVGGETALLSTTADPQLFKSAGATFLDKGLLFFKAGESIVRDTSWFTAYREWKAANPTKVLDNRALGDIGNRYQTLSLDMTRASNSALNEGILSVPTQFWTWNARFAEQMLDGNRLTLGEKARAFTMYSAMYGIPATLGGITFGAIPYANYGDIRQYAINAGINVHDKWYQAFSEGLPSMLLNAITGHETSLQRFGPNATQLKDIIDGKKSAYETLGGASGTFVAQVMKTVAPFFSYGFSAFQKDSGFPLHFNDLVNVAENSSTLNNAEKMVRAWNSGSYISKTEGIVASNLDKFQSVMLGLGLNPQSVNDAYTKMDMNKAQKSQGEKAQKEMTENWLIASRAGLAGDYNTMTDYMTRVHRTAVQAGLTKAQERQIYKNAMKGNESMVDSVEKQFQRSNPNLQSVPRFKEYLENKR